MVLSTRMETLQLSYTGGQSVGCFDINHSFKLLNRNLSYTYKEMPTIDKIFSTILPISRGVRRSGVFLIMIYITLIKLVVRLVY